MIKIFDGIGADQEILTRKTGSTIDVSGTVAEILSDVRTRGDSALLEYEKKFDGAELGALEVSESEISEAAASMDSEFMDILHESAANITAFHSMQKRTGFVMNDKPGIMLGQKIIPLERVGIYVPGGTASYPSSVLMNAIPAKIAGVGEIIMTTPPSRSGKINPAILAAARVAGVDRIFKTGGAQAVAALAFGTDSIPRVDKIVGPGNVYVAEAKRQVYGLVAIDMIAGPSEILIIADGTCDPEIVAADMLSQAEHDKMASAVLITDSRKLADGVSAELERQIPLLPRQEIARASVDTNGKIFVTDSIGGAVKLANELAPEHLELCVDDPFAYLDAVKNAGSVFLGKNCPEALGDYFAGPNHTLPTSGTARFSSPLSVDDFIKKYSFTYYTADALDKVADKIDCFANREGLQAHGKSAVARKKKRDRK